jgi:hypothetical protein
MAGEGKNFDFSKINQGLRDSSGSLAILAAIRRARLSQQQEQRANAEAREVFFQQRAQLSVNRPLKRE